MDEFFDCAFAWGKYQRAKLGFTEVHHDDFPSLWRKTEEFVTTGILGDGNKPSYTRPTIPIAGMNAEALRFHRGWFNLSPSTKTLLAIEYIPDAPLKEKARMLNLSTKNYLTYVKRANQVLRGRINA